jgi:hypothetical protein
MYAPVVDLDLRAAAAVAGLVITKSGSANEAPVRSFT